MPEKPCPNKASNEQTCPCTATDCERHGVCCECIRAHIVGSATGETKLLLDIDEKLFAQPQVSALEKDLDFIFDSYEVKPTTPQ